MTKTIFNSLIISLFALGMSAQAQNLIRKSAEFRNFGGETATTAAAVAGGTGGASIYTKTIATSPGENILYMSMFAAGDTHNGAASHFSCNVDSGAGPVVCNPGPAGAAIAPPGWITLNKIPNGGTNCNDGGGGGGDCHDNAISYQWCKVIPDGGGPHTVNLRMASSSGAFVFIETVHFFIDATKGGSPTCTAGSI